MDKKFVSISITEIIPDVPLPGDLYLFVSGHFIKYKNIGDELPAKKYHELLVKQIQFLFTTELYVNTYRDWYDQFREDETEEFVAQVGENNRDIIEDSQDIKESLFKFITADEVDQKTEVILNKTRDFVVKISERQSVKELFMKMMNYKQSMANHSSNVANLATFLAMNIGYNQQTALENIYVGALLHDYGKIKIPAQYADDPDSMGFKMALRRHPEVAKNSLMINGHFNDEVLRIISEHHERHDGKGFPMGLKGSQIFDLTKIVSIANVFDNMVMNGNGDHRQRQRKAIKLMQQDKGSEFDPKILTKCLKVMEKVV